MRVSFLQRAVRRLWALLRCLGFVVCARSLSFLPGLWKGFGVRASYTHNRAQQTLPGLARHQVSAGLNYALRRFNATVNWLWVDNLPQTDDGTAYTRHRATLDANLGCKLSRRVTLFVSGRNLTNARDITMVHYAPEPAFWRANSLYGATYTTGVKGTF